jgi:hypothetical protein
MSKSIKWQRRCLFTSTCLTGLVFFLRFVHEQEKIPWDDYQVSIYATDTESSALPCRELPGANDTVVVLRTGSTEIADKLSVHLSTTLNCYPNHLIFSDHGEIFQGESIIDALESVSADIVEGHSDFELYRRLKRSGNNTLETSELSGVDSETIMLSGKLENPGWKLDKWKFLPMINRTFHDHPDMKWYVFVEAYSSILASQLSLRLLPSVS